MSSKRLREKPAASGSNQENLASLIEDLKEKVEKQEEMTAQLQQRNAGQGQSSSSIGGSARPPSIPFFSGEGENCTSSKVRSFVYNVRKAGEFSNFEEGRMLALAECYLTDSAASWLERLEADGKKPSTVDQLKEAMIREFVPPDEIARAKIELMDMHMSGSMDTHVQKFKKLIEITCTPLKEAYVYFFMSLPAVYKEEFHKKFPGGEPVDGVAMSDVYKHARDLATAKHWNSKEKKFGPSKYGSDRSSNKSEGNGKGKSGQSYGGKINSKKKDDALESWGPVQAGEKYLYIKADRCMDCGKKGWKDLNHPCRQKKASDGSSDKTKN